MRAKVVSQSTLAISLSKDIIQTVKAVKMAFSSFNVKLFYFTEASSGEGKSQLAFALPMPVIYLPLSNSQSMYKCFDPISNAIKETLEADFKTLDSTLSDPMKFIRSQLLKDSQNAFRTVGLLVSLFQAVYGKSNEDSMKLLSGYDNDITINYSPMTLSEARAVLSPYVEQEVVDSKTMIGCKVPLFVIDEVPSKDSEDFNTCIFLRNLIRCMKCVCMLSGTEAAAMNFIDDIKSSSRDDTNTYEYVRLITKLPPTNLSIFAADIKYTELIQSLSNDVITMLQSTRPLFVEFILDAMLATLSNSLTSQVLSIAKKSILSRKTNFASLDGLYAQIALLHAELLSSNVKLETRQYCIRHHFGALMLPEEIVSNNNNQLSSSFSLYVLPEDNTALVFKNENNDNVDFKPRANVVFALPSVDPLLHLICLRDGIYYYDKARNVHRVPTSYSHLTLSKEQTDLNSANFLNINQKSSSGKYFESELSSAAIIASHSCPAGGSPFELFLRSFIAELSIEPNHTLIQLLNMPKHLQGITIGVFSPANTKWDRSKFSASRDSVLSLLDNFQWSKNGDLNDAAFSVQINGKTRQASLEAKCYQDNIPTDQLIKTMKNSVKNDHIVTIMVVTKAGTIQDANKEYKMAKEKKDCNVIRIRGNADESLKVASQLSCELISDHIINIDAPTVIMIDLESIYFGRYEKMRSIYQST